MAVKLSRYKWIVKFIRGKKVRIPIRIGSKGTNTKNMSMGAIRKKQGQQNKYITKKIKEFTKNSIVKKPVYHGTNRKFKIFKHSEIGSSTGTGLGRGFYFTSNKREAKGYGKFIHKVFLKIKKPVSQSKETISRSKLRKMLRTGQNSLSNWGDINYEGKRKVINRLLNSYKGMPDIDKINALGVDNFGGNWKAYFKRLKNTLGYDSAVKTYANKNTHYVPYNVDQIMKAPKRSNIYKIMKKLKKKKKFKKK